MTLLLICFMKSKLLFSEVNSLSLEAKINFFGQNVILKINPNINLKKEKKIKLFLLLKHLKKAIVN